MENPIISWLFETDAVRVCPEGQPFWYTSGKLGPFYINTQFLFGSEAAANALLKVIEDACAGDKLTFYDKVYAEIDRQLASCSIYAQLIDLLADAAKQMDVDFVSGGERRDFFFSMPVARKLGMGHLTIFKDLSTVYTDKDGVSMASAEAGLAGKRSVHIADLITVASSYVRAWIPAVESLGAKIAYSLAVVDRDQGGAKILADAGCPLTTLVVIKPELFETAKAMGRITAEQVELVNAFIADPDKFLTDFLTANPDFLANEIAKGGKSAQRAELCIASGFAPECALPKK
ncbi:MAG: orotate phosphoribosyltransferase [Clostridia bacterium]|nr:orotate phosphoribosyltransferase [Clostridia bacterium]